MIGWFDAVIIVAYLIVTMAAGILVRKYVGKVEHFIVAGREMNVYLGIASLAATEFGVVTCMYTAQNGYDKGFAGAIPGICMAVPMLIVGLTGFCIKPLRDRGVMTIPEFFQERFGTKIRWMGGVVIVLGGLLNMGVFLRKGGEFLVYCTGLPPGYLEITMTALLLGVAIYTILGGMLSVLITDYLQFVVMSFGLIVVTILILWHIGWTALAHTVQTQYGAGGFNPFIAGHGMGWQWVTFNMIMNFAVVLTWQTTVARVLAAKDSKTGQRIYTATSFFFVARFLIPGIWGIAALATLGPAVAGSDTSLMMPRFLAHFAQFMPVGMMGLLVAAMLAADMSTDSSYMLTWASVIYNDILAPYRRRRPWSERKGLLINRFIVAGIGCFLLVFGLWYELKGSVWDYLTLTGSIYLSSMATMLIACCYWKRANSWGAAGAIIVGAAIPLTSLVLKTAMPKSIWALPETGHYAGIAAFVLAALAMVVGSLLGSLVHPPKKMVAYTE